MLCFSLYCAIGFICLLLLFCSNRQKTAELVVLMGSAPLWRRALVWFAILAMIPLWPIWFLIALLFPTNEAY
jgi:hypothetical protein